LVAATRRQRITRAGSLLTVCPRMKYLLVLIPLISQSEARPEADPKAAAEADPVNSLLTTHALSVHPLSNPILPLSPNGVAAAHAAGRVHPIIDHHLHPHPIPHPLLPIDHHVHHPLLHPPTLSTKVPVGACKLICSILDLMVFNPDFSTFVSLIRAAGLVDLLSEPGPITVFAPTNAAFDALPPPAFQALLSDKVALQSVLLRHMSRGPLISKAFPPGPTPLVTGAGERVTVTAFPNQVTITSVLAVSHIIDVDNEASNGVVHVVDSVF